LTGGASPSPPAPRLVTGLNSDLSSKSHIRAIRETKFKDKLLINISIPGYTFLHTNSVSNAGGVGIYVSNLLKFNKLTFKSPSFGSTM